MDIKEQRGSEAKKKRQVKVGGSRGSGGWAWIKKKRANMRAPHKTRRNVTRTERGEKNRLKGEEEEEEKEELGWWCWRG